MTSVKVQVPDENIQPEASEAFVATEYVRELTNRALSYLEVGYPVHFAGPAGTGKTTLAFHVAAQLDRPVMLIHGDDEFGSSDLVGRDDGYHKHKLVDNFIHSVLKTEEQMNSLWVDSRLTTACMNGSTLIYDEFTRSRPEANNVLLSVLEEKILNPPKLRRSYGSYLEVHPDFRAIFTSNPEEYAGTHKTQNALMDRIITINLGHYDRETEILIVIAKSNITQEDAEIIVDVVRQIREIGVNNHQPTIRASIAIARILSHCRSKARKGDWNFCRICHDVLNYDTIKVARSGQSVMLQKVDEILRKVPKD